ncbi:MAG: YigZ family protein [Bacteroides graminisolvens]
MVQDTYKTIADVSEGLYTEKRSKFIAVALPVKTVEEIKSIWKCIKRSTTMLATCAMRTCWGTNGKTFVPMTTENHRVLRANPFGAINSNELTDILVIVVRYFGGIKLGTSGLIVAYKAAAAEAIAAATILEKTVDDEVTVFLNTPS